VARGLREEPTAPAKCVDGVVISCAANVDGGAAWPACHCAFIECYYACTNGRELEKHLQEMHFSAFENASTNDERQNNPEVALQGQGGGG
jgi:hypothetical protein